MSEQTGPVGIVGLGLMGQRMALRLAKAGIEIFAWNRTVRDYADLATAGVQIVPELRDVLARVDIAVLSLTDGPAVKQALCYEALWEGARATAIIDTSSIRPQEAREVANWLGARRVDYFDAPVSGGTTGAEQGSSAIFLGGDAEKLTRVMPLLSHLGRPTHLGPTGAGQAAKLANQIIVGINIAGLAEALKLSRAEGIDIDALIGAMQPGLAGSRVLEVLGPRMAQGDFATRGRLSTHVKDLQNALSCAAGHALNLPETQHVSGLMASVLTAHGDPDHSAVFLAELPESTSSK